MTRRTDAAVVGRRAVVSPCGVYRYHLSRVFDRGSGLCCFVMLNPSTADGESDDPTVRRCIGYATRWGYQELHVVNLFALRSTHPEDLSRCKGDPVGPLNMEYVVRSAQAADRVVCAWGTGGDLMGQGDAVKRALSSAGVQTWALAVSKSGQPKHPLYLRKDLEPVPY